MLSAQFRHLGLLQGRSLLPLLVATPFSTLNTAETISPATLSTTFPRLPRQTTSSALHPSTFLLPTQSVHLQQFRTLMDNPNNRLRYFILKERPLGPYKKLAPGVKVDGRVGKTANYRRIIHYPADGKYTIKKLKITKLGGRDPVTGRKIIEGVGGGSKQLARWIDWFRLPKDWDPEGPDLVEKIISINYDPTRDAKICKTAYGNKLRWQIATENMKAGDLIRTSGKIPSMPVKPVEGDSYPLGALPVGTTICLLQQLPGEEKVEMFHGEDCGKILRKSGDRVIVRCSNKLEYSMDQRCQCVVGTVSIHPLKKCIVGSPNRQRWLGNRPRSGLWQRKTGRFGRKIKKPPPLKEIKPEKPEKDFKLLLHSSTEGLRGAPCGKKRPMKHWMKIGAPASC